MSCDVVLRFRVILEKQVFVGLVMSSDVVLRFRVYFEKQVFVGLVVSSDVVLRFRVIFEMQVFVGLDMSCDVVLRFGVFIGCICLLLIDWYWFKMQAVLYSKKFEVWRPHSTSPSKKRSIDRSVSPHRPKSRSTSPSKKKSIDRSYPPAEKGKAVFVLSAFSAKNPIVKGI